MQYVNITDAGLADIKGLTKLRWLYLYNCVLITDAAISKLKKALPNCDIERVGQRDSSRQRRTVRLPGSTTDKQLAQKVKGLTRVSLWLDLTYCTKITDAGLVHLKGLTNLEWLNLKLCRQITDAGLAHLKGLTKLTLLNLAGCDQITDAGLVHLKGLTTLKGLSLSCCRQITDAGLAHLKGLTNLEKLSLWDCDQITDAGLVHLKGLTKLERLYLTVCVKITDAAVSKLQKALPNCYIIRPY